MNNYGDKWWLVNDLPTRIIIPNDDNNITIMVTNGDWSMIYQGEGKRARSRTVVCFVLSGRDDRWTPAETFQGNLWIKGGKKLLKFSTLWCWMVSPCPAIDATYSEVVESFQCFAPLLGGSIGATYSEVVEGAEGVWLLGQVLLLSHLVLRKAFRNPNHRFCPQFFVWFFVCLGIFPHFFWNFVWFLFCFGWNK